MVAYERGLREAMESQGFVRRVPKGLELVIKVRGAEKVVGGMSVSFAKLIRDRPDLDYIQRTIVRAL
jgi:hypothetical protein